MIKKITVPIQNNVILAYYCIGQLLAYHWSFELYNVIFIGAVFKIEKKILNP